MNATLLALSVALGATLAPSKIGIVQLGDPIDPTTLEFIANCPRVAKWVVDGSGTSLVTPITTFKSNCPFSQVVVQVKVAGVQYSLADDAAAKAAEFWNNKMLPALSASGVSGISKTMMWFEGPAPENLPDWSHSQEGATWFAAFWSKLFDLMYAGSYWPVVGPLKSGEPALADELGAGSANPFCATIDAIKAKGKSASSWAWGYQVWSQDLGIDLATELQRSLRYRAISQDCGLSVETTGGVPLILTEGGQTGGWKNRHTTAAYYMRWLRWLDSEISKDKAVRGFALFQMGERTGANAAYEVTPFVSQLEAQIINPERCDAGPCSWDLYDAGVAPGADGGTSGGGVANPGGGWKPEPVEKSGGCQSVGAGLVLLPILGLVPAVLLRRRRAD